MNKIFNNIQIGDRIGHLTIIGLCPKKYHQIYYRCQCDCGAYRDVSKYNLTHCYIQTCNTRGCQYAYEYQNRNKRKINQYNLDNSYGIGYTNVGNKEFYFDKEDYDIIKNYSWYLDNAGYVRTNTFDLKEQKRSYMFMHNLIMGVDGSNGIVVDHIGGKNTTNDNRKSNLRVASVSQNNMNQCLRKDNSSGVKGVSYSKSHKKWCARIQINNKRIILGEFDTFEKAKQARLDGEKQYCKEFSYDNSQMLKEVNNETLFRY